MKTLNELIDGDWLWLRIISGNPAATSSVRRIRVRHVIRDSDQVSRMTGLRESFIRMIEFERGSRLHYRPEEGNTTSISRNGMDGCTLVYYTDEDELLWDLEDEKQKFIARIEMLKKQIV